MEKSHSPISRQPQSGSPDERDTSPAFPSCLSKSRPLALFAPQVRGGKFQVVISHGFIREARVRVQDNLETAVQYSLRPRQQGLSLVVHWLRPKTGENGSVLHRR